MAAEASWGRGQESPTASRSEPVGRISLEEKLCSKSRSDSAARRWMESRCWRFYIQEVLWARTGARNIETSLLPIVPILLLLVFVSFLKRAFQSQKAASVLESSHIRTASSRSREQEVSRARDFNMFSPCRFPTQRRKPYGMDTLDRRGCAKPSV